MCSALTRAPSFTATSSRQVESAPPEIITSSGSPAAIRSLRRAASSAAESISLLVLVADVGPAERRRLVEALELDLADLLEPQPLRGLDLLHHRVGDDHLAAARPRDHAPRGRLHPPPPPAAPAPAAHSP